MIVYSYLPTLDKVSPKQMKQIKDVTLQTFTNDQYRKSISGGTARSTQIKRRITSLYDAIAKVIELAPLPPSLKIN
jgi:hypothetical protein